MILFLDIEILLKQNSERPFGNLIFNEKVFNWIKSKCFDKIFIVTNEKGIAEGNVDEKFFDSKLEYIRQNLEHYTKTRVFCHYYPYQERNGLLIKDIIEAKNIDKMNSYLLGFKKSHKKDASLSGIKYIDLRNI